MAGNAFLLRGDTDALGMACEGRGLGQGGEHRIQMPHPNEHFASYDFSPSAQKHRGIQALPDTVILEPFLFR